MIGRRSLKCLVLSSAVLLVALAAPVAPAAATTPASIDTSYGSGGVTLVPGALAGATIVDTTGRALVLGLTNANGSGDQITRLTVAGQVDASFNNNTGVYTLPGALFYTRLTTDAAGLIYVLGGNAANGSPSTQLVVTRLTTSGVPDSAFGNAGTATITLPNGVLPFVASSFTVRPDGDVIVSLTTADATQKGYLAAVTKAGILDTTFGGANSTGVMAMPTKTFALKVAAAPTPAAPAFTAASPPLTATVGTPYSYTFKATGIPAPTFTVDNGGSPPSGVTLDPTTGVLSGTPTAAGNYTFTVRAANGVTPDATAGPFTIVVAPMPVAPVFTTPPPPPPSTATVGTGYSYTFVATGPPTPTYSIASGALPPGLMLDGTTGKLSGSPSGTGGTYAFSVKATNGVSPDAVVGPFTITVGAAPVFTADSPPATANVGTPYSYTFAASGTPAPTFSYTGTLPAGLSLNSTSGVLSGTPTTAASYQFQVNASNSVATTNGAPLTITVSTVPTAPRFTAQSPPSSATVGVSYSYKFAASGNPAPTYSLLGTPPTGLTLNPTTGVLSGKPTVARTFVFRVKASNGVSPYATTPTIIITVHPAGAAAAAPTASSPTASSPTASSPTASSPTSSSPKASSPTSSSPKASSPTSSSPKASSPKAASPVVAVAGPDPNVFVALVADDTGASRVYSLQRYLTTGAIDPSFGVNGITVIPSADVPTTMIEANDGTYYVTGTTGGAVFLAHFLGNGAVDTAFGTGGVATGPAESCTPTGAVLFAGGGNIYVEAIDTNTTSPCAAVSPAILLRFHNGALDSTFGTAGEIKIDSVGPMRVTGPNGGGVQPLGQVLVGINGSAATTGPSAAVTRVNATPVGPTIEAFNQLSDDSHFSAATVAPNPAGTYLGPVSAAVVSGVAHVYAEGANHHLYEFTPVGTGWTAGTDLTAATTNAPTISTPPKAFFDGTTIDVFALGATGDLVEYQNNGAMGAWTTTDVNTAAGATAPKVTGLLDPHAIAGTGVHLYAVTTGGDLVEVDNDNASGHTWNFYDITKAAGGGVTIANGPAAILIGSTPHVYTRAAANNDLVEYVADHANNLVWNAYDVTAASGGPTIGGSPIPVLIAGIPHVYAASAATGTSNGDLIEFVADQLFGRVWNAYDQSSGATGAPKPVGNPSVVLVDGTQYGIANPIPEVWETATNGDLTAVVADHRNPPNVWNVYDVTALSGGPQISGDPTPVMISASVQVFGLGKAAAGGAAPVAPATGAPSSASPVRALPF